MKFVILGIVVLIVSTSCGPVEKDSEGGLVRARRATCDLLSIKLPNFAFNDSACAAHCIAMLKGFKGGRCKSGVCHCRK